MHAVFHHTGRRSSLSGFLFLAVLILVMAGCSGLDPSSPSLRTTPTSVSGQAGSDRALWGYYLMHLNEDHTSISVEPVRDVAWHLNALGLIQSVGPTAIALLDMFLEDDGSVTVQVSLTHPAATYKKYTAFDVRGIVMFPSQYEYPTAGVKLPGYKLGEAALLNPDGYTRRWNPTEFTGKPSPFNYIDGDLIPEGMGALATATVNPYKAYWTKEDRRCFEAGGAAIRHYNLSFPPGPMVFAYAVDASWGMPTKNLDPDGEPLLIPGSFQLTANSVEPYNISLSSVGGELTCSLGEYAGGTAYLTVRVQDWRAGSAVDFSKISIEAPTLFDGIVHSDIGYGWGTEHSYSVSFDNTKATVPGTYPVLYYMECPEKDDTFVEGVPLTAYQVFPVNVVEIPPPFCLSQPGIHNVFSGLYNISGTPGALHMDCSFLPIKVGGVGGLLFDGGILGGNELIQMAMIPSAGGPVGATTLFKRTGGDAGRALVVQTDEFSGHILLVSDADPDNLLIYNAAGTYLKEYDLGTGDAGRNEPVALVTDPTNGDVWMIGHKGTQGIHLERWAYIKQGTAFDYTADYTAQVDLMPWLGTDPKPLGIAVNGEMHRLYIFHAKDNGTMDAFDFSQFPPVHLDEWSRSNVMGLPLAPISVNGLRKLIGGDLIMDHVDGEDAAQCRMLAFANTATGGSKLVKLDAWCQQRNFASLGSPLACMAINNLPEPSDRTLVLFPTVQSINYLAFLAPTSGW